MAEFEQHSLNWYRSRLGYFTGSMIGKLMMVKKNGEFYDTALALYLSGCRNTLHES